VLEAAQADGLVTTHHNYEQVHQPHAEQQKHLDECEPTNHDNQHQGDTLLSHPGSLNLNHDHFRQLLTSRHPSPLSPSPRAALGRSEPPTPLQACRGLGSRRERYGAA